MLIRGTLSQPVALGVYCGFTYHGAPVSFAAPCDMHPGDVVAVDTDDGQPYAVYRPSAGVVWRYVPPVVRGSFSGTWQESVDFGALLGGV